MSKYRMNNETVITRVYGMNDFVSLKDIKHTKEIKTHIMLVKPKTAQNKYSPEPKFSMDGVCENAESMIPIEISKKSRFVASTLEKDSCF